MRAETASEWAEVMGYYGPDSLTWRLGGEAAMLLGGGRAVLMQLAHPLVAAGVGRYSSYGSDPWGRVGRTIDLMQRITFGTRTEARIAARTINRLHLHVTGTLGGAAGDLPSSTRYSAHDPDLLLWVHATLVDTILTLYPLLVSPLSRAEQERYYEESKRVPALLGLPPAAQPQTLDEFHAYIRDMLASDRLALTSEAREVQRIVLHMPVPPVLRPLLAATEQVTIGILPERVRDLYGLTWDSRRQMLLDLAMAGSRRLLVRVPQSLREMPYARAAYRRTRGLGAPDACA